MRSELAVPLIGANGRLEGVVNLESPRVAAFSDEDRHLLQALATQAVIAIQEARLLDALQDLAWRVLTEDQGRVFAHIVRLARSLLNATACTIWILEEDALVLVANGTALALEERIPVHGSLTGVSVLTREAVISPNVQEDPRFFRPDLARTYGWGPALVVPMLAGDEREPVGAIAVYWLQAHLRKDLPRSPRVGEEEVTPTPPVSDWDRKVLTILAHYAALAVHKTRHQEALQRAQEQRAVAEAFAVLGDVAANVLHQLNNKVGTIPVRVEGIEDKCGDVLSEQPYLAQQLAAIEQSAREALDAVRESLGLLRPLHCTSIHVKPCIAEAITTANLPPTIHVEVEGVDHLPPVYADRRSLTLVFVNLLQNAAEAMQGAGRIHIQGYVRGKYVHVRVTDTGPGIPPEVQPHVFELDFSRRRGEREHRLGFGLWWVKTLMVRLGGNVSVDSDGVQGTTFTLTLPIVSSGGVHDTNTLE